MCKCYAWLISVKLLLVVSVHVVSVSGGINTETKVDIIDSFRRFHWSPVAR